MSEDKSYLNELMDWINENHRKRGEEVDSLSDTANPNKPFTKQIMKQNPNIPQDDVQDYVKNVKDDQGDYAMGVGMSSPALKVGANLEGLAARLPEVSRFRSILDNPIVQKVREPFKQQRNIDMMDRTGREMADIAKSNQVIEKPLPEIDDIANQKAYKNWLNDKMAFEKELGYKNNQTELQNIIDQHNKLGSGLDETQPAISQELIDQILNRKAK